MSQRRPDETMETFVIRCIREDERAKCADEIARLRKALDTIAQVTIDPVAARRAREALQ